jgi:hypothetical protein
MHTRATHDDISFQLALMISSLSLVLSLSSFRSLLSRGIYVYLYMYTCTAHKNESRNPMTGSQARQGRNPRNLGNLFSAIRCASIVSCCLFIPVVIHAITTSVQLVLPLTYLILTNRTVSVLSDIAVLLVMMMLSDAYLSISIGEGVCFFPLQDSSRSGDIVGGGRYTPLDVPGLILQSCY